MKSFNVTGIDRGKRNFEEKIVFFQFDFFNIFLQGKEQYLQSKEQ